MIVNCFVLYYLDPPVFINAPSDKIEISEGKDLDVKCTARGYPVPIVKWYGPKGSSNIISSGKGSVSLKIQNIRRFSSGTYACQANNKLPQPITKWTSVIIYCKY